MSGKADKACEQARNTLCVGLSKDFAAADRRATAARARMNVQRDILRQEAMVMNQAGCPGSFTVPNY